MLCRTTGISFGCKSHISELHSSPKSAVTPFARLERIVQHTLGDCVHACSCGSALRSVYSPRNTDKCQPPRPKHNGKQSKENNEHEPAPSRRFAVTTLCRFHFYRTSRRSLRPPRSLATT